MKLNITAGLIGAIVLQFLILTGIYVGAQVPLWTGTEVRLKTVPVDPRSLFRGNYARLEYDFSQLSAALFAGDRKLREGEVVYVSLKQNKRGLYELSGASLEKPEKGIFLRGRVTGTWLRDSKSSYRVKYGIEAFFAPKEKALGLESDLRNGGVAEVMISGGGRARLKDVTGNSIE
ncbi:GDYXXLXY domain-containing protein [Microbulbifer magnicolonia]|uniref:GDYXXLXY domain-containing protein n=1 Tax=Microbulbifer magnicolonia TaxID=3109744 RepID=UPI002B4115C0|nr:GDYXXLXY domain-containing protein [Microbulbifer sp. GG15]